MGHQGLSIQVGRFDGDTLIEAALLNYIVTEHWVARNKETGEIKYLDEENKALIDGWQNTGENTGLDMAMDGDGDIYERIDGELVKT